MESLEEKKKKGIGKKKLTTYNCNSHKTKMGRRKCSPNELHFYTHERNKEGGHLEVVAGQAKWKQTNKFSPEGIFLNVLIFGCSNH